MKIQVLGGLDVSKKSENAIFVCANCGKEVLPLTNGSYRNHCPYCLYSLHIDNNPGDRSNECGGLMEPIGVVYNSKKGYQIIHKCKKCGFERRNILAENTIMPDDFSLVIKLTQNMK